MQDRAPLLRIENVSKRYGKREVLRDVSLSVCKGDLKILIGPSGAGKSTLLQCINFLVKPDEGRVWLEGEEVKRSHKKDLYAYRQKVGMIFQDFNLFDHLSALQNVMIGLVRVKKMFREDARARAMLELERVGLRDHTAKYPAQLSGGQKQRLSIARALVQKPPIYIFDDSFSALDFRTDAALRKALKENTAQSTLLIVTQRVSTIKNAEQIIVLEEGKVVGKGSHDELMETCQTYREIALSQLSMEELQ